MDSTTSAPVICVFSKRRQSSVNLRFYCGRKKSCGNKPAKRRSFRWWRGSIFSKPFVMSEQECRYVLGAVKFLKQATRHHRLQLGGRRPGNPPVKARYLCRQRGRPQRRQARILRGTRHRVSRAQTPARVGIVQAQQHGFAQALIQFTNLFSFSQNRQSPAHGSGFAKGNLSFKPMPCPPFS